MAQNRDIEVLRAIAIGYVIIEHWVPHFLAGFGSLADRFESYYTSLWSGVDLFFCISGYVIARSTLAAAGPDANLGNLAAPFWIRRIFRLWPSAWVWALVPLAFSVAWNGGAGFGSPGRAALDAAAAILNGENVHYYSCLQTHSCGSLSVYWSLSLEEQFYLLFPLLLLLLRRRTLVAVVAALAIVQILLPRPNSFLTHHPSLLWLIRSDGICLGILLALFEKPTNILPTPYVLRTPLRAGVVTIALLAVLATAGASAFHIRHATGLLAIVSCALVWIARFDRDLILPRTRFDPVVLWVGSRSYSLYLTHAPCVQIASELAARIVLVAPHIGPQLALPLGVTFAIGLTLVFSELNFRFIETPLRATGRRVAQALTRPPARHATGIPAPHAN